jgi:hypothetical protein
MRRTLTILIGVAATATMITGAGVAAATTSHPASPRPAATRIQHFQLMTTSATSNKESIIALGSVFTAGGVDHSGNTVDRVVFPGGTFKIRHSPGKGPQHFNAKTCLITINQHGTYTIGNGTGRFKGISGHGKYRFSIVAVGARNSKHKCSQSKPPVAFQQVIKAQGPLKL